MILADKITNWTEFTGTVRQILSLGMIFDFFLAILLKKVNQSPEKNLSLSLSVPYSYEHIGQVFRNSFSGRIGRSCPLDRN